MTDLLSSFPLTKEEGKNRDNLHNILKDNRVRECFRNDDIEFIEFY